MSRPDLDGLFEAIFDDVRLARQLLEGADTPFNRRVFVRTVYASIEAFVFFLKFRAIEEYEKGIGPRYSPAQLALLREETYSLDPSGKVQTQQKFIPLDQNFRFLVATFLHRDHLPLIVDWGQDGWNAFKTGLKTRNRITHPKCGTDLIVSDQDLDRVRVGHKFVMATVIDQFIRALESVGDRK